MKSGKDGDDRIESTVPIQDISGDHQATIPAGFWATVRAAIAGSEHDYTTGPVGKAVILLEQATSSLRLTGSEFTPNIYNPGKI